MLAILFLLVAVQGATIPLPRRYNKLGIKHDQLPQILTCEPGLPNPFTLVSIYENSQVVGLNYSEVLQVNAYLGENFGLYIANVSSSDIPDIMEAAQYCEWGDFWINAYGGVLPPFGCSWLMNNQSDVYSSIDGCQNQVAPYLARLNYVISVNTSSTVTFPVNHRTVVATVTDKSTEFFYTSTTESTKYEFVDDTITTTMTKILRGKSR